MVNMAVGYARPDRALLTLRDEVYAAYGYTPARASEFVTGYKSPSNFTGHNADANGVVHAVDIFTDESGNLPEAAGRELAQKIVDEMKRRNLPRGYVIHDMSPGAPWPAIASYATGYQWVDYTGPEAHSDHIHVSMCDMYWGDPAPVGPDVYDSTASWNLGATVKAASAPTIQPIEEFLMSLPDQDQLEIRDNLRKVVNSLGVAGVTGGDFREVRDNVRKLVYGQIDLAASVAAQKAAAGASEAQIKDAVKAALAESTVAVDVTVKDSTRA